MRPERRYTLPISAMTSPSLIDYKLKPLEIAVFWFTRDYVREHGKGVTVDETIKYVGRDEQAIRRAWRGLEKHGLLQIEARVSELGNRIKNASD